MLYHGTISRWNDSRGFGFITQDNTKEEIFFHISDCPQHGIRPQIGFIVSYRRQLADNGKVSARQIQGKAFAPQAGAFRGQARPDGYRDNPTPRRRPRNTRWYGILLMLMLLLSAGITAYSRVSLPDFTAAAPAVGETGPAVSPGFDQAVNFSCDGRQHCSQMRSREEVLFFIQHCPDTKMDGDGDGEPCESQFAN